MISLSTVNAELVAARPYFSVISPSPGAAFTGRAGQVVKHGFTAWGYAKMARKWRQGTPASTLVGEKIANKSIGYTLKPVSKRVDRLHVLMPMIPPKDLLRKNGMGARSWINEPGQQQMVIVFHDANRAGPHIDVHIGRMSVIYRVKPEVYAQLRYNNKGYLTDDSKKLLMDFVREEIADGSRVPQNLDHSITNARASWVDGDPEGKNYGDGPTRQVISETTVDVIKTGPGHPIELYAPVLNPHRSQYIYQIYPGDGKSAPILIWGNRTSQPPVLEDRLHLKLMPVAKYNDISTDADLAAASDLDWDSVTGKYDGSSCYVVITKKGTTVWSPRQSVRTGEQIEYTHKLDGLAATTNDETIVAMGELLFKPEPTLKQRILRQEPDYLPCASGSGILNSNEPLPDGIKPEIRLYRVDRVGRNKTGDLDFYENRALQEQVAQLDPEHLKVVELMTTEEADERGFEGFVIARTDGSVNDAYKVKWTTEADDWRIDVVDFKQGERGGTAGVIVCTSLESGKEFKLGPGQVGNRELTDAMAANPELYEGTVIKVESRRGHEGRAAKVVGFHDDKGLAAS